ncbi:MAG: agglutinin biogenesis protein MshP [Burkholderiales bacterium]|nr:agglutinin biogenesis protein MshP [Burkholderiales bacterium]
MSATCPEGSASARAQRGFSIVSALFILVVLAALAAGLVNVSVMQHSGAALDLQGVRAYQAARAGIEWGVYRILDPEGTPGITLPSCWGAPEALALAQDLAPMAVSVTCTGPSATTELDRTIGVYRLSATATFGTPQTANHVSRTVEVTVSRCIDPANPPEYRC